METCHKKQFKDNLILLHELIIHITTAPVTGCNHTSKKMLSKIKDLKMPATNYLFERNVVNLKLSAIRLSIRN